MRWRFWGAFVAGLAVAAPVWAAHELDRLDLALRRAALELTAGRPGDAAGAMARLAAEPGTASRADLATLLRAESELLNGDVEVARGRLEALAASRDRFVRTQAAAHRIGLALAALDAAPDVDALRVQARLALGVWDRERQDDAPLVDLAAACVARMVGEGAPAAAWLERARRGAGTPAAALLRGEEALARGDADAARREFETLERQAPEVWTGWAQAWGTIGLARARMAAGDRPGARARLAQVSGTSPLGAEARLYAAQLAYADHDVETAAGLLTGLNVALGDAALATEADLLRLQVALDRGAFAAAESLGLDIEQRAPERLAAAGHSAERLLELDVQAWHAARATATLKHLASEDVLRGVASPTELAGDADVVRVATAAPDSARRDCIVLLPLVVHEVEPATARAWRDATRRAGAGAGRVAELARARERARTQLAERDALLDRGRAELATSLAALAALEEAAARLRAGVAAHTAEVAAAEQAWTKLLQQRLALLARALGELRRADTRLGARYPPDRSVRRLAVTAEARVRAAGTLDWVARAESLQTDLAARVAPRVHAVLEDHELASDLARLEALEALLAGVRSRAAALAAALDAADAAERIALAAAEAALDAATQTLATLEAARTAAGSAAQEERTARAARRRAGAVEAAAWGEASAAFHAALATPPGDAARLTHLEHAATRLDAFASRFTASTQSTEALYRLGEVHLQRATMQYQQDLAAYLTHGGHADTAPLPVESYADAVDAYRRLLRAHPDTPRAHDARYALGFVLAETGAVEASCDALEQFLAAADSLDLRRDRAALRLGDNRLQLDDREAALAAFRIAAHGHDPESRDLGLFRVGWCAYDLDHHDEARLALRTLLAGVPPPNPAGAPAGAGPAIAARTGTPRAAELAPEALELLALAFSADQEARAAATELDTWPRPPYDFALLRRMTQLFASRAQYDEAIDGDELLLERHPAHRALPAVAEDLLHWIEVRHGTAAAHARAARLAATFAPDGEWARQVAANPVTPELQPRWQSRLVEEDRQAARVDSLTNALARPEAAAARMAQRLRAAAQFEHREARRDSVHRKSDLEHAVALYQETLQHFPGAEEEPTTHLYLGEARFELGAFESAADAYGHAAAHPRADSALVHTASGQELAALDAAAALQPAQVLERYEKTTERFAKRYPNDGRGTDAFERIGFLAFRTERWDAAERGYSAVAWRTKEPARAAAALKMTGDVAWKREHYEAAAARYDSALTRARLAHADTLQAALVRLVPAALYRGAEAQEKHGDKDHAATAFERVAARHPKFDFADRALFRAAALRAASGDSAAAAADYGRVVDAYPHSDLHAGAWLERGRCEEGSHQTEQAARTFRAFAGHYPQHAQATPARLRAGLLFAVAGRPAAADSQYAIVLAAVHPAGKPPVDAPLAADLWMRRAHLMRTPGPALPFYRRALECGDALGKPERAEAQFQIAEASRPEYEAITLKQPITAALQRKQKAVEPLLAGYGKVAEASVEPWHAAACLRLGETLTDLGHALRTSEPPAGLEGDDLYAYQETLGKQADALDDRAVQAWSRGLMAAHAAKHADPWTKAAEKRLYPMLATRVPVRPAPLFVLVNP